MTDVLFLVSILVTGSAVVALLPEAMRKPALVSLRHGALASVALAFIAVLAGGLYLLGRWFGIQLPLSDLQTVRLAAAIAVTIPAGYLLVHWYRGGFNTEPCDDDDPEAPDRFQGDS